MLDAVKLATPRVVHALEFTARLQPIILHSSTNPGRCIHTRALRMRTRRPSHGVRTATTLAALNDQGDAR